MSINGIGNYSNIQNNSASISSAGNGMGNNSESAALSQTKAADKVFADTLQKVYDEGDKKELKKACQQFESIMMSMMYKQMKATISKSDFMETSQAKEIYEGMLDDELMDKVGSRGIGLADILYKQLSKQMDRVVKSADAVSDIEVNNASEQSDFIGTSGTSNPIQPSGTSGLSSSNQLKEIDKEIPLENNEAIQDEENNVPTPPANEL